MTEKDILDLIAHDSWMMDILHTAENLHLPHWLIGAGFVRNKVWDHLHGYKKEKVDTNDIDLVYYNLNGNDQKSDEALSKMMYEKTGIKWEIVNEIYAHEWNKQPPFTSVEDAISYWPETATCVGVNLENNKLRLIAPHGIDDLAGLIIRPSPGFSYGIAGVKQRAESKQWKQKWPKLKFSYE